MFGMHSSECLLHPCIMIPYHVGLLVNSCMRVFVSMHSSGRYIQSTYEVLVSFYQWYISLAKPYIMLMKSCTFIVNNLVLVIKSWAMNSMCCIVSHERELCISWVNYIWAYSYHCTCMYYHSCSQLVGLWSHGLPLYIIGPCGVASCMWEGGNGSYTYRCTIIHGDVFI